MKKIRLTQLAKRAGCAAKQPPDYLLPLLDRLPAIEDPRVLVAASTADDAGVYRLTDEVALVMTTDFFTPIVDDPYDFGAVAAANALSDVYAMGGRPLSALNLVGFPAAALDAEVLVEILRGGADKAKEAGIEIVGGHTLQTDEPIYGLAVTGTVHPDRVVTNATAQPGDLLVLTKPLGVGIVCTAAKNDWDEEEAIGDAIAQMCTLNRAACEAMVEVGVHAATDVTGFGLLGHLRNLLLGSRVGATLWLDAVPFIGAATRYAAAGVAPGGTHRNRRFVAPSVDYDEGIDEASEILLSDAQTSGGLLMAVDPSRGDALLDALRVRGVERASVVGRLDANDPGRTHVLGSRS